MKTQEIIYKILEVLDEALDQNNPDFSSIKHENLGISKERWSYALEMMQDAGLIKGVVFVRGGNNRAPINSFIDNMNITLNGIMYLADNSTSAKVYKAAKMLKDVIPGL